MGDCQNYGPLLGPYYNTGPNLGDPKKDQNFDNPPCGLMLTQRAQDPLTKEYSLNGTKVLTMILSYIP